MPHQLPQNVINIIREYSKPITRPDWRQGSKHATIFKYSPAFVGLKESFINVSLYFKINLNDLYDEMFCTILYDKTFNEIIQNYSESAFNIYGSYKPEQMNFYRFCRLAAYLTICYNNKIKVDIPTKMTFTNEIIE